MSQAIKIFRSFWKNPKILQDKLGILLKNKELKIKKIELLKEKLIIKSQYKITALINLKNSSPAQVVAEIHDNLDYFNRNVFALKNFKKLTTEVGPAKLFGLLKKDKIIIREYLKGNFLSDQMSKKEIRIPEFKATFKKLAIFLACLHNLKIKNPPFYLSKNLNKKIEKIILQRTIEFIKPNIEFLRVPIKNNLKELLKKMDALDKINKICLIHGDYQIANAIFKNKDVYVTDFDTLEIGNPARDIGRFVLQMNFSMKNFYSDVQIKELENLFLDTYLKNSKLNLYPNLETNINLHKAEMIQYIILGTIWEEKTPSEQKVIEIQKLLENQNKLLKAK